MGSQKKKKKQTPPPKRKSLKFHIYRHPWKRRKEERLEDFASQEGGKLGVGDVMIKVRKKNVAQEKNVCGERPAVREEPARNTAVVRGEH